MTIYASYCYPWFCVLFGLIWKWILKQGYSLFPCFVPLFFTQCWVRVFSSRAVGMATCITHDNGQLWLTAEWIQCSKSFARRMCADTSYSNPKTEGKKRMSLPNIDWKNNFKMAFDWHVCRCLNTASQIIIYGKEAMRFCLHWFPLGTAQWDMTFDFDFSRPPQSQCCVLSPNAVDIFMC